MSEDRWAVLRAAVEPRPRPSRRALPPAGAAPLRFTPVSVKVDGRLLAALLREVDELNIAIHGGCGCPPPYDQCTHDEPLLPAYNREFERARKAEADRDALASALTVAERALRDQPMQAFKTPEAQRRRADAIDAARAALSEGAP